MTDIKKNDEINDGIVEIIRRELENAMDFDRKLQELERRTKTVIDSCNSFYEKYPAEYVKAIKRSSFSDQIRQIRNLKIEKKAYT